MVIIVHAEGKIFDFFSLLDCWKMAFPHFKGKPNSSCENIKMKLTLLKKVSKVVHFTDLFLRECSVYRHFEFELKK